MCIYQCLFVFAVMFAGMANSWDFALTKCDRLEFYENNRKIKSVDMDIKDSTDVTYDPVSNTLILAGRKTGTYETTIFSYDIIANNFQPMLKTVSRDITSLAFDPEAGKLFWIDRHDRSIRWIFVEPGTDDRENIFIKEYKSPQSLALDNCKGYVYWNYFEGGNPVIERARYDGSEREVLIRNPIGEDIQSVAIDQYTRKMFWFEYIRYHCKLVTSDLDGQNKVTLLEHWGHSTGKLSVTKYALTIWDESSKTAYRLSNPPKSEGYQVILNGNILSIVANYKMEHQKGQSDCKLPTRLRENKPCVHGTRVIYGPTQCECTPGYIGEQCDISVCHNFCFSGRCTVRENGKPKCSCPNGYSGEKCESITECHNYCLNNGTCSLNEENNPVCQCDEYHVGLRCEKEFGECITMNYVDREIKKRIMEVHTENLEIKSDIAAIKEKTSQMQQVIDESRKEPIHPNDKKTYNETMNKSFIS